MNNRHKVYLGLSLAVLSVGGLTIELLRRRHHKAQVELPPQHPENLMVQVECEYCAGQGHKTAVSMEGYGNFEYPCKWCNGQGARWIPLPEPREVKAGEVFTISDLYS